MKMTGSATSMLIVAVLVVEHPQSFGQDRELIDVSPTDREFAERSLCSDYLRMLPPAVVRKLDIKEASKLREIGQYRLEQQNARISQIRSSTAGLEDTALEYAGEELVRFDNSLANQQFDKLSSLLSQEELDVLMREYFRHFAFEKLLDPLAACWLSITAEELEAIAGLHQDYQAAMAKVDSSIHRNDSRLLSQDRPYTSRITIGGNLTPTMKAQQAELSRLEARRWSPIAKSKLQRCFQMVGFIERDETLADFLSRNPETSKTYIEEIPAFAIAQVRADAESRRNR